MNDISYVIQCNLYRDTFDKDYSPISSIKFEDYFHSQFSLSNIKALLISKSFKIEAARLNKFLAECSCLNMPAFYVNSRFEVYFTNYIVADFIFNGFTHEIINPNLISSLGYIL